MKTLKLVLFALAFSAGSLVHATPGNSPETSDSFNKEIQNLLKNIELDIEEEVVANLVVSFNEKNEMQVLYVGILGSKSIDPSMLACAKEPS